MRTSEASASPTLRSKKPLHLQSSQTQSSDPIAPSTKTPEKPPQLTRRLRNRGVALSVAEIKKVAESLQDQKRTQQPRETASLLGKSARRQISLPSPSKPKTAADGPFNLPEKYEILGEFFDSLDSSIRLLRLKQTVPTFTNIRPQIECLTDRRFTHGHLAQLKSILPEAIVIKKILVCDERTPCMKPELHVTLNPDAVESDAKLLAESRSMSLRKLFRTRLKDFFKSHPEGDEIPEEVLPEPFNHPKQDCLSEIPKTPSSALATDSSSDSCAAPNQQVAVASHMSQSFRRRFSLKYKENGADNVQQNLASDSFQPLACPVPDKSSSAPPATPSKTIECTESKDGSLQNTDAMSTPAKLVSTPSRLMTATPAIPPPKRRYMSPDDNASISMNKLVRRPPRSRSLKFDSPLNNKETENEDDAGALSIDYDIFDILPEETLQSIKEKERMAMEERDPAISQAKRRQKMISSLPMLFNMIHLLFHSLNRSVMKKEELVNKIISSHRDIVDRSEVEEQLNLLLEIVPEWISEKLASNGDFLFSINKMLNPETIRASLEEAK